MLDKKVTRKEFLLSALSIGAIFAMGKVPGFLTKKFSSSQAEKDVYGNSSYGGGKKIS